MESAHRQWRGLRCYTINTEHIHLRKASSGQVCISEDLSQPFTFHMRTEVGRDLLRWGSANGQGGGSGRIQGLEVLYFHHLQLCLSLPGAQACPQLNKMWQENMNQGAKEFVKLSWLLAPNPFAVAPRLALACRTSFPRGQCFPPARPSEPPWEPETAKN